MVYDKSCLATYKGADSPMGFLEGHIYNVVVTQKKRGCELSVYYDKTIKREFVKENIPYASELSIQHFWEFKEEIVEGIH